MPSQQVRIPFPLKGLTANVGYESSDLQSTSDCLNIVPESSAESRTRGGTRPGLTRRYNSSVNGTPKFSVRVSGGDNTRVYEYLVVGTEDNIYVGQSIANGTSYPITYSESLGAISGNIVAEASTYDEYDIITEDGLNTLVLYDFDVAVTGSDVAVNYRDRVIIGSDGSYHVGSSGTFNGTAVSPSTATLSWDAGSSEMRLLASGSLNPTVSDWTTEGIEPTGDYVEILTSTGTTPLKTYKILSAATAGYLVIGNTDIGGGTVTYSIRSALRDLDPNTPTIDVLTPTAGYVPVGSDDIVSYRDRLVHAKNRTWYMSRQGDAGDYDFSADPEDPSRAVAGTTAGPGEPADPIISMASGGYDYLVLFSEAAVWVMRGDPGYGGQLYQASSVAGCIARKGWCYGDSTEIYFLGKDGLYMMEPNAGQIRPLSQGKLPRSLRGLDRDNFDITLVYDPEDDGVIIFIVPVSGAKGTHYYYDIQTGSFWPFQLSSNTQQPLFASTFGGSPTRARRATIVSRDGYVRDWSGIDDDGEEIRSHVVLGPYLASEQNGIDATISEIVSVVDEDSAQVYVQVYVGSTSEEVIAAAKLATSPDYSFTVRPGRSYVKRPRVRGSSFCIRVSGAGVWAFESMSAMIAASGRNRRF